MARHKSAVIEYRRYYLPINFPVLLLSGDYWKISDIPSERLHFHNCLEIGICHSDSGTLEISSEPLSFQSGDVTIIPRNIPHTTYSTFGTESHWSYIFLDPKELFHNILPAAWNNYDLNPDSFPSYKYILSKDHYPQIYNIVCKVIKELEEQQPCYQISVRGLLASLYIELYRIQSMEKSTDDLSSESQLNSSLMIAPALDYIEDNYMNHFSIDYLADLCHWSPTHFRRVFHEIMGTSPLDFLNNTRITKSCSLLQNTEESVLNISEMVGFRSVSSYNRYFIKTMQISPREYRKQMQQTNQRAESKAVLEYAGWMFPE